MRRAVKRPCPFRRVTFNKMMDILDGKTNIYKTDINSAWWRKNEDNIRRWKRLKLMTTGMSVIAKIMFVEQEGDSIILIFRKPRAPKYMQDAVREDREYRGRYK